MAYGIFSINQRCFIGDGFYGTILTLCALFSHNFCKENAFYHLTDLVHRRPRPWPFDLFLIGWLRSNPMEGATRPCRNYNKALFAKGHVLASEKNLANFFFQEDLFMQQDLCYRFFFSRTSVAESITTPLLLQRIHAMVREMVNFSQLSIGLTYTVAPRDFFR